MSDITKCSGQGCPHKESCYRFTAPQGELQSYFVDPPLDGDNCDMYWGPNGESIWNQLKDVVGES
jgi:hypothetical protein